MREGSIRGLRAFCAAARHLSFKAAAEELCVTPSAVSHQIKALEERLQAPLFERRAHELVLTHLGGELRAQVEPLLCELDNVTARFEQRAGRRRMLRISVMPFFASELLVPHLSGFAERHRAIDIRVDTTAAGAPHAHGLRRLDPAVVRAAGGRRRTAAVHAASGAGVLAAARQGALAEGAASAARYDADRSQRPAARMAGLVLADERGDRAAA